jgi:hypothetical protein
MCYIRVPFLLYLLSRETRHEQSAKYKFVPRKGRSSLTRLCFYTALKLAVRAPTATSRRAIAVKIAIKQKRFCR